MAKKSKKEKDSVDEKKQEETTLDNNDKTSVTEEQKQAVTMRDVKEKFNIIFTIDDIFVEFLLSMIPAVAFIFLMIFSIIRNTYVIKAFWYVAIVFTVLYGIIIIGFTAYTIIKKKSVKKPMKALETTKRWFRFIDKSIFLVNVVSTIAYSVMMLIDSDGKASFSVYSSLAIAFISLIFLIFYFLFNSLRFKLMQIPEALNAVEEYMSPENAQKQSFSWMGRYMKASKAAIKKSVNNKIDTTKGKIKEGANKVRQKTKDAFNSIKNKGKKSKHKDEASNEEVDVIEVDAFEVEDADLDN